MSIVKNTNKKTGITYVYESESYWDPEKKQPRNRRKLIGKLDANGNIVPTGKRGRTKSVPSELTREEKKELINSRDEADIYREKMITAEAEAAELRARITVLEKEKAEILESIAALLKKHQ